MKMLPWVIKFCLLLSLIVAILFVMRNDLFEGYSQALVFVFHFLEF